MAGRNGYSVRAVDRALQILSCFNVPRPRLNFVQLSDLVELDKSTVYRMLCTLDQRGFVRRDPISQYYEPGLKILELGEVVVRKSNLTVIARPYLEALRDQSGETAGLFYWAQVSRICVEQVESMHPIRQLHPIGQPAPMLPGAIGKAMLSTLDDDEVDAILVELQRTYGVTVNPVRLKADLERVRTQGYSQSRGEAVVGADAATAPIRRHGAPAIAAIAVYGPRTRVTPERIGEIGQAVRQAATEISRRLEGS